MLDPALRALIRTNFTVFLRKVFETLHPDLDPLDLTWYLEALCHHLEEVRAGRLRRLAISMPPRHLKSIAASVAFPAFMLGHEPNLKIMVVSYGQELAREHAELFRRVIESSWFHEAFPEFVVSTRGDRQLETRTTRGGGRRAISVGGPATGFGADVVIVDDCLKADEAHSETIREGLRRWFTNTLSTRFNDVRTGRIVSIQQRLHEDDLVAHLLDKGYSHLKLASIAEESVAIPIGVGRFHQREVGDLLDPVRFPLEVLDRLRLQLGAQVFSAQYQQEPVPPGGAVFRVDWFGTYKRAPLRERCVKVIQSWDTAESAEPTSDFSVGQTWGLYEGKWLLLDVKRVRLDYTDLKRAVIQFKREWQPDLILVEKANSGRCLLQELRRAGYLNVIGSKPRMEKVQRAIGQTAQLESRRFLLPTDAPWLDAFRAEVRAFPYGRNDDQVDAMVQFLEYQMHRPNQVYQSHTRSGRARYNGSTLRRMRAECEGA